MLNGRRGQITDKSHNNHNSKAAPAGRGESKGGSRSSLYSQSSLYPDIYTDKFVSRRPGVLRLGESQLIASFPNNPDKALRPCPQLEEIFCL